MSFLLSLATFLVLAPDAKGFSAYNCTFSDEQFAGVTHGLRAEVCPFAKMTDSFLSVGFSSQMNSQEVWVRLVNDIEDRHSILYGKYCSLKEDHRTRHCLSNGSVSYAEQHEILKDYPISPEDCQEAFKKLISVVQYYDNGVYIPYHFHIKVNDFTVTEWHRTTMLDLETFAKRCKAHHKRGLLFPGVYEERKHSYLLLDQQPVLYNHANGRIRFFPLGIEGFGKTGSIRRASPEGGGTFLWGNGNSIVEGDCWHEPPLTDSDVYVKATFVPLATSGSDGGVLLFWEGQVKDNKPWVNVVPITREKENCNLFVDTLYQKMTFWIHDTYPAGAKLGTSVDVLRSSILNDSPNVLTHGSLDEIAAKLCGKAKFLSNNRDFKTKQGHVKVTNMYGVDYLPCQEVDTCVAYQPSKGCYNLMPVKCKGVEAFFDVHTKQVYPTSSEVPCHFDTFSIPDIYDNSHIMSPVDGSSFTLDAKSWLHEGNNYFFDFYDDRELSITNGTEWFGKTTNSSVLSGKPSNSSVNSRPKFNITFGATFKFESLVNKTCSMQWPEIISPISLGTISVTFTLLLICFLLTVNIVCLKQSLKRCEVPYSAPSSSSENNSNNHTFMPPWPEEVEAVYQEVV